MLRRARELAAFQLLVAAFPVLGCTAPSHPQSYPDLEQRGSIQATRGESTIDTVVRFKTEMRADSALSVSVQTASRLMSGLESSCASPSG
jgi:hypothetical protein